MLRRVGGHIWALCTDDIFQIATALMRPHLLSRSCAPCICGMRDASDASVGVVCTHDTGAGTVLPMENAHVRHSHSGKRAVKIAPDPTADGLGLCILGGGLVANRHTTKHTYSTASTDCSPVQ